MEYDDATLAFFGYTQENLQLARQECIAVEAACMANYKSKCLCRMCSSSDIFCSLCKKPAYSGPHSVDERMCAKCGWYCSNCVSAHPEYMIPEEWMFLTCKRCDEDYFVKKYGQSSEDVRSKYVQLLIANSCSDGLMRTVEVPGFNGPNRPCLGLKPEAYELCLPSERVERAFALIGAKCIIDKYTHFELGDLDMV